MNGRRSLLTMMVLSVALVATLAVWDDAREAASALEDFAAEQSSLAQETAAGLGAQLEVIRRDADAIAVDAAQGHTTAGAIVEGYLAIRVLAPAAANTNPAPVEGSPSVNGLRLLVFTPEGTRVVLEVQASRLLPGSASLDRPGERLVLLLPPLDARFRSVDGRSIASSVLRAALDSGQNSLRLARPESAALGLPARTSMAGLARLDAGPLGRWSVAVVTSAGRERDREQHARWRVVLGVLLVAVLVGGFGAAALTQERRQFELARRLAASERESAQEAELAREGRAATMVTLAAGIAHEVSTPLGVIAGRAEQLAERLPPGDERGERCVRVILEQTQHIREVIQGLLHVAQGGAPVLEAIAMESVVQDALELVAHRFASAGVEVSAAPRPEEHLPEEAMVRGDPRLLEHAVINLLLNACDACTRGGRVQVRMDSEPGRILLAVEDDGSGIDPAHAARIGEPFFSTKTRDGGTGLGLAITTEIVRIHRGQLTFASRRPKGTAIATITLPTSGEG